MKKKMLMVFLFVAVMSAGALADSISTQNVGAMPLPLGDDNYSIMNIDQNRWEGQQITVTLPLITAVDWAVLAENHPWHNLSPNAIVETRVYLNDGALPGTLLGSAQMQRPLSPISPPGQTFTYKFVFATPIDVSGYVNQNTALSIVWGVLSGGTGEYETLHSPPSYYPDMGLISYNGGATWSLDGGHDRMFHVYGDVPEPATISLLGLSVFALLRKKHN